MSMDTHRSSPEPAVLTAAERRAPRERVEHALVLIGRVHKAEPEQARAAQAQLLEWRQACADNAEAAATAQRIWNATEAGSLRDRLPAPASAQAVRRTRRAALGLLGFAGTAAIVGGGGRWFWTQPTHVATLRTQRAQMASHVLPDGSRIDLAANTTLHAKLYRDQRLIHLAMGEARFEVTHDPDRPFVVETEWGHVRVVGTVFAVAARGGRMSVAVAQGRVAVWAAGHGGSLTESPDAADAILSQGETIETATRWASERARVDVQSVGDWKQGWLAFNNTRLVDVVARWNDYLSEPIRMSGSENLSELRVTGSYLLRDPQAFLSALPSMLPVKVAADAQGMTVISARR